MKKNKKKSIISRIAIIFLIISILSAGYVDYYKILVGTNETKNCCITIGMTEKEITEREKYIQKNKLIEKKIEQAEPVCAGINFICFLGLIGLLITAFIKKEKSSTKWLIVLFIIVCLYRILFGYLLV